MKKLLAISLMALSLSGKSQCPVSNFNISPTACLQENIKFVNNSSNYDSLYWDFCSSDLLSSAQTNAKTISGLSDGWGYKIVNDSGNWYSFIANRATSSILRLDYGTSLDNQPSIINLGNIDSQLSSPEGIDIIENNGTWFGFVPSLTANYGIIKLEFGNSLSNSPTASNIGNFGHTGRIREVKVVEQNGDFVLVILQYESKKIVRINFRDSFSNTVNSSDIYESLAIPDAVNSIGIQLINTCGNWKAIETSVTSEKIIQLNFGIDILSEPTIDASYSFTGVVNPRKVNIVAENNEYFVLIANASGNMSMVNFHDLDIANAPTVLENSAFDQLISIGVATTNGKKYIHGVNGSSNLYTYTFNADCGQSLEYSNEFEPINLTFSTPGTHSIELTTLNNTSGYTNTISKSITISPSLAPQPSSQITGNCLTSPISFSGQQISGDITTWSWDFGDGSGSSNLQDASYTYASAGEYQVKLSVTDANGCTNLLIDTVQVYEEPIPNFSFSGGTSLCKNNLVTFTNSSTGETGDIVNWNWDFNGEGSSSERDPAFTFLTAGIKNITLTSSIPGCANVIQQSLIIIDAPTTNFEFIASCNGGSTNFTDLTIGDNLTSWNWDFGDGNTSTDQNTTHTYALPGSYDVTLLVANNTGCFTSSTQTVINHSIPTAKFNNDLPCSTTSIQFTDQSLVDNANIIAWEWNFGDGSTSTDQHPTHLYGQTGNYEVKLKTYSQFGCADSTQTVISVDQGPQVDFEWDKNCQGEPTTFTDLTNSFGNPITKWTWIIDGVLHTNQNPSYAFSNSGTYTIQLSVTMDNLCTQTISQDIIIETPPVVQFDFEENCATSTTSFYDLTDQTNDVIIAREWRVNGAVVSSDSIATTSLTPGNYEITLSVITEAGCEEITTNPVTLVGSPQANYSINTNYGATPLLINFSNSSSGGNDYFWSFNDANNSTSTEQHPSFIFTDVGEYNVTLRTSSAPDCYDEITQLISVVAPVTKSNLLAITPVPDEGKTNFILTIENSGTTLMTNTTNIIFRADYGAEVVEPLNAILYAGKTINYTPAFAILSTSSTASLCVEIRSPEDIQLDEACITLKSSIIISEPYPNPSKGLFTIDVILESTSDIQIQVFNSVGQPVISTLTEGKIGLNQLTLNGNILTQGIYIVEVKVGEKREQYKISITR